MWRSRGNHFALSVLSIFFELIEGIDVEHADKMKATNLPEELR